MRILRALGACAVAVMVGQAALATMPGAGTGGGAGPATSTRYTSLRWGFSVEVPAGWKQVPTDVLNDATAAMQKPGGKLVMDAAFQPAGSGRWLSYPYAMVEVIPYSQMGLHGELPESQFGDLVKSLTGTDVYKKVDEMVSTTMRGKLSDMGVHDATLDAPNRRFRYSISMTVAGAGRIEGESTAYFGRDALVQVAYYAQAGEGAPRVEGAAVAAAGRALRESLVFDPGHSYNPALAVAAPGGGNSLFHGIGPAVARGAVIGAVAAVVGVFIGVRRKNKS
jgi:hypothetical protein